MAIYTNQDIAVSLDGDIELGPNGDLSLADSLQTHKAAANFVLRTDFGDYQPDKSVGCNLGSFIGKLNTRDNREFMKANIDRVLQEKIYAPTDTDSEVVPFDMNEVLCVINIGGEYLIDGIIQPVNGEKLAYSFPYIDGTNITPIQI